MRKTGPFDSFQQHRDAIFRWVAILAALVVAFPVPRHVAMRPGGWGAVRARARRECAITGHAFAGPVRTWLRHRRSPSVLVRGPSAAATRRDAERALVAARQAAAHAGGRPYAALVDADTITVPLRPHRAEDGRGVPAGTRRCAVHRRGVRPDAPGVARDSGQGAIVTLVRLMEDHRDGVVVIAAGHPGDMESFVDSSTGPASCFTRSPHFTDCTSDELLEIVEHHAGRHRYELGEPAREALTAFIGAMPRVQRFGNGRAARQFFQRMTERQALRVPELTEPGARALVVL
jgi:hypothetical protein